MLDVTALVADRGRDLARLGDVKRRELDRQMLDEEDGVVAERLLGVLDVDLKQAFDPRPDETVDHRLGPRPSLALPALPMATEEPLKLIAVALAGKRH